MSFYLGPGRPVTALSTWDDIETAGASGLLGEHQWIELKEDLGPANRAVNTELAKDLASLAVDGGLLIFGVNDHGRPVGCDAAKIAQRVSQVAAHGITPPLSPVIHDPIPSPANAEKSVLIVSVPASPVGPHMVDQRYWGRSSDGKRPLSDPEVRRLIQERTALQLGFEDRLRALEQNDPLETRVIGGPQNGHLYVLAEPLAPLPSGVVTLDANVLRHHLGKNVSRSGWRAGLEHCLSDGRDPDGTALVSVPGQVEAKDEKWLTYVSVKDDGRLVVVSGGGMASFAVHEGGEQERILIGLISRLTHQALDLIRALTLDSWGYQGPWRVGVRVTKLGGVEPRLNRLHRLEAFTAPEYVRTIVTTPVTWEGGSAERATNELLAGLYRGLGLNWSVADMLRAEE